MRRRAEPEDVKQQRLVITFPAVFDKSAFRAPAMGDGVAVVLRPLPVRAPVKRVGEGPDLQLLLCLRVKIAAGRQGSRQQESAVHRRQLAMPGAPSGLHVEKVIVKPFVARRIRFGALRSVPEEPQRLKRALQSGGSRHEAALDSHGVDRQREARRGYAGGPVGRRFVRYQSVERAGFAQKISE